MNYVKPTPAVPYVTSSCGLDGLWPKVLSDHFLPTQNSIAWAVDVLRIRSASQEMAELFYMRCWVGIVGCVATIKALHGYFHETYSAKKIYTLKPAQG